MLMLDDAVDANDLGSFFSPFPPLDLRVASNQRMKDRCFVAKTPKVELVQTSTPWT
jgi:hypothetical protein